MTQCRLCYNLKKKNEDDFRLAFDFAPSDLEKSAGAQCAVCKMILDGILHFEDAWDLSKDVSHIYVFGLSKEQDSLSLEVYFKDEQPKLVLELYRHEQLRSSSEWLKIV
jgi:hypothetical protein